VVIKGAPGAPENFITWYSWMCSVEWLANFKKQSWAVSLIRCTLQSLRAGVIKAKDSYQFVLPESWVEQRIANIQSGNFCMVRVHGLASVLRFRTQSLHCMRSQCPVHNNQCSVKVVFKLNRAAFGAAAV